MISTAETIVVLNTGSGLKDVPAAMEAVNPAPVIEPTLAAVEKTVDKKYLLS
jgi:threonine synthase